MKKQEIIDAVVSHVQSTNSLEYSTMWCIGLTHEPDDRKHQHDNEGQSTKYWKHWQADSLSDAQQIESYFINEKGMRGGTGGDLDARKTVYVYVF